MVSSNEALREFAKNSPSFAFVAVNLTFPRGRIRIRLVVATGWISAAICPNFCLADLIFGLGRRIWRQALSWQ
jgi:hypothetical protein